MTKKSPTRKESGFYCSRKSRLSDCLNDECAYCEQRDGDRNRRNRCNLLPPVGGGARGLRQRSHDPLLDTNRSHAAAKHLALGVDPGPELDLRLALDFTGAHHVDFPIKPVVQQPVTTRSSIERNFAVVERLGGLIPSGSGLATRNFFVFETSVI